MCTTTNSDDVKITQNAFKSTQEFNLSALPPDLIFFFFFLSGSSSTGMVGIPIISVVHPVRKKNTNGETLMSQRAGEWHRRF